MATIRIFIASSSELLQDRKDFREFLSIENDRLQSKGVYLKLEQWENFLDTVSPTRLQDEYNKELKKAQIVICLFYTKAGKYTLEEFDTALKQFKETGSPLIYTYFRSGAPDPDPNDQPALDLASFKKRLSDIGHFNTVYNNIDDLKYQFRKQLDRLEDKGFIVLKKEIKNETSAAVTNYFNIKNAVIGSTISAGGDVNIGDKITNAAEVTGSNNIIIQSVNESSITVNVNGRSQEIEKRLDVLQAFLEQMSAKFFQTDGNIYNIGNITNASFGLAMGRAGKEKSLPAKLKEDLLGEGDNWIKSLEKALIKEKISVSDDPLDIIQKYDWLIQVFLQKMLSPVGQEKTLRRLSFMAEAYQASLRYLCYIQLVQVLQMENAPKLGIISDFIQLEGDKYLDFDYAGLLLTTTDLLGQNGFMKEINVFVENLNKNELELFGSVLFLEDQRRKLIANQIAEDEKLPALLDEYLTALICWLKELSFLANYKMVSIKEINLNYHLGTYENYLHRYGELNSLYEDGTAKGKSGKIEIQGSFTYSKSILLFKGSALDASLKNIKDKTTYLSLSPLLIDKSVYYDENTKQTPEIFYYTGYEKAGRKYIYSQLNKELNFTGNEDNTMFPPLNVKETNTNQSGLDDLFEQLNEVFKPFKTK